MAKAQFDFSGARGIVDPLEGLRASMQQASSNLGQMITQDETRKQQELTRAREVRQDALTTPGTPEWLAAKEAEKELKMGLVAAEHDWKMKNDKGYRATIPGTEEYELARQNKLSDETAIINARSAADLARDAANPATKILMAKYAQEEKDKIGQEVLAKEIFNLPRENVTSTTITPEQVADTRTGLESAAVTRAGDVYNAEYTKLTKPETRLDIGANGEVITYNTAPAITPEEAHQKAMERAGLLDVSTGKAPIIDEKLVPKAGTTETSKKFTADEEKQKKMDAVGKAVREGRVPATVGLAVMQGLTPVKTQEQKIAEGKLALDMEEFKAKKEGGMFKKSANDNSKGDWIKSYDAMIKTYGSPDILGKGDQADLESQLAKIQSVGYSDKEMTAAIDAARGVYGSSTFGVDEDGFIAAVKRNLSRK